jgi:hypothetical protein
VLGVSDVARMFAPFLRTGCFLFACHMLAQDVVPDVIAPRCSHRLAMLHICTVYVRAVRLPFVSHRMCSPFVRTFNPNE